LIANGGEVALDCAIFIAERFGWLSPAKSNFSGFQEELLQRSLGRKS
jgi:hypothetical protein